MAHCRVASVGAVISLANPSLHVSHFDHISRAEVATKFSDGLGQYHRFFDHKVPTLDVGDRQVRDNQA